MAVGDKKRWIIKVRKFCEKEKKLFVHLVKWKKKCYLCGQMCSNQKNNDNHIINYYE